MILQCLGGWCSSRESCAHYWAEPVPGRMPVERLCGIEEEPEQEAGRVANSSRPVASHSLEPLSALQAIKGCSTQADTGGM